jgi:hypothetical protein
MTAAPRQYSPECRSVGALSIRALEGSRWHDEARATLEAVKALAQKQFVSPYRIASYYAVTPLG